jgi:hypothetical protein
MRTSVVVLGTLFTLGFVSNASAVLPCQLEEGHLTYGRIKSVIEDPKCKIDKVEDFLNALPENFRKNYALLYRSRSIQGPHNTDYVNPRALVFGTDSHSEYSKGKPIELVVTFNGKKSDPGYDQVEMLEIRKPSRNMPADFNFFESDFSKNRKGPKVSKINQDKCTLCHGLPSHPLWDGYPVWIGAYGGNNFRDTLAEINGYKSFLKAAPAHSRYSLLLNRESRLRVYNGKPQLNFNHEGVNSPFTAKLMNTHWEKVIYDLIHQKDYQKERFALLGVFAECVDFTSFFPPDLKNKIDSFYSGQVSTVVDENDFTERWLEVGRKGSYINGSKFDPEYERRQMPKYAIFHKEDLIYWGLVFDTFALQSPQKDSVIAPRLRYLFEPQGIDTDSWYINVKRGHFPILNGGDPPEAPRLALLKYDPNHFSELSAQDLNYLKTVQYADNNQNPELCQKLAELSRESLKDLNLPEQSENLISKAADNYKYPITFKNTCAQCHDPKIQSEKKIAGIPPIPFGDQEELERYSQLHPGIFQKISKKVNLKEMPPTRDLNVDEVGEINEYLTTLTP